MGQSGIGTLHGRKGSAGRLMPLSVWQAANELDVEGQKPGFVSLTRLWG